MRRIIVIGALVALVAAACGGASGNDGSADPEDCADLTTQGDTFTIRMRDNEFLPSCFTASASQGITIVNEGTALHSFTLEGTQIDVDVRGGETFRGEAIAGAVAPGSYELICTYHVPTMDGEVIVVE